jgi:hypothetical protein
MGVPAPTFESTLEELRRASGEPGGVDAAHVQQLLAAAVSLYAAKVELEGPLPAFSAEALPTASEVCIAATAMLDAVSVEVFELALWKTWTPAGASS